MQIKIKTLKGEIIPLEIDPSESFMQIKQKIGSIRKMVAASIKLVYKGKAIEDSVVIGQTGIKQQDFIVMMNVTHKKKPQDGQSASVEKSHKNCQKKQSSSVQKTQKKQDISQDQPKQKKQLVASSEQINLDMNGVPTELLNMPAEISKEQAQQILYRLMQRHPDIAEILRQDPQMAQDLLFQGQIDLEQDQQYGQNQLQVQISQQELQAITRLQNLGFKRQDVLESYFVCDKNQQLAANMLFQKKENGDLLGQVQDNNDSDDLFQ